MKSPRVSILILTAGRPSLFERALDSIWAECRPELQNGTMEVITVVNGLHEPDSISVLQKAKFPTQKITLPKTYPGAARNHGIRLNRAEWIFFLDDDAYLPAGFMKRLLEAITSFPTAAAIGGPNLTPPGAPSFQRAVGLVLQSRLGSFYSNARFRKGGLPRPCGDEALMLCNLLLRASSLAGSALPFDPLLSCNEENLLIQRLQDRGEIIIYCPDFHVFHDRRGDMRTLAAQILKYGRGRAENTFLKPGSLKFFHLVPPFFLIYLSLWPGLLLVTPAHAMSAASLPLLVYAACVFLSVLKARDIRAAALFPLVHFAYGFGFMAGILNGSRRAIRRYRSGFSLR